MLLDEQLLHVLDNYLLPPPKTNQYWYKLWIPLLSTIFPLSKGFFIEPITRTTPPTFDQITRQELVFRVHIRKGKIYLVLVVKVLCDGFGEAYGKPTLLKHVENEAIDAFNTGFEPIYWIAAMGSSWCYGQKMETSSELMS